MKIYIPQNIDPYNTHLKNLIKAYKENGADINSGLVAFAEMGDIPDVIHFHFIEPILKHLAYDVEMFFKILEFYTSKGVIIIYTIHDSKPHSRIDWTAYNKIYSRFLKYIRIFIHHGHASVSMFLENFPQFSERKHLICHHGDYLNDMGSFNVIKKKARELLKLHPQKNIILVFGQLQFKNTGFAEEVFKLLKKKYPRSILLMTGVFPLFRYNRLNKPYYWFNNKIINFFKSDGFRILKRFTQYEAYLLFQASDVIFLPHDSGLTTGIIPLAATLRKPFIYPDIGVFSEQAEFCKSEKYICGDIISASSALDRILSQELEYDNTEWLINNNWNTHASSILKEIQILTEES